MFVKGLLTNQNQSSYLVNGLNRSRVLVQSSRWQCGKSYIIKRGARRSLWVSFALNLGFQDKESSKLKRLFAGKLLSSSKILAGNSCRDRWWTLSFQFNLKVRASFDELENWILEAETVSEWLSFEFELWPRVHACWDLWRKTIWTWRVRRGKQSCLKQTCTDSYYGIACGLTKFSGQQMSALSQLLSLAKLHELLSLHLSIVFFFLTIAVHMLVLRCDMLRLSLTIRECIYDILVWFPSLYCIFPYFSYCEVLHMWQEIALEVAKRRRGMRFFTAGRPRLAALPNL